MRWILLKSFLSFLLILETALAKNILRTSNFGDVKQEKEPEKVPQNIETIEGEVNAERDAQWPLGIVHYYLDHADYDDLAAERIRLAMNTIEEASCLLFKALTEDQHDSPWIHIANPDGVRECIHHTTTNGTGHQIVLVLGYECLQRRDVLHSLLHALGFRDEVTHPQRDQYVRILWDNLHPGYRNLFRIHYDDFPTRTTEYDPMSIMHFHDRAFTKNGQATIAPLIPGLVINPARELSPLDKMKLRLMFGHECNRRKVGDLLDTCKTALKDDTNAYDDIDGGGVVDGVEGDNVDEVREKGNDDTFRDNDINDGVADDKAIGNDNDDVNDEDRGNNINDGDGDENANGNDYDVNDNDRGNDNDDAVNEDYTRDHHDIDDNGGGDEDNAGDNDDGGGDEDNAGDNDNGGDENGNAEDNGSVNPETPEALDEMQIGNNLGDGAKESNSEPLSLRENSTKKPYKRI